MAGVSRQCNSGSRPSARTSPAVWSTGARPAPSVPAAFGALFLLVLKWRFNDCRARFQLATVAPQRQSVLRYLLARKFPPPMSTLKAPVPAECQQEFELTLLRVTMRATVAGAAPYSPTCDNSPRRTQQPIVNSLLYVASNPIEPFTLLERCAKRELKEQSQRASADRP